MMVPMQTPASYFDGSGRDDVLSGGVKLIPITTPKGEFRVWTKRVGNNPKVKVLLLHGGPGATHEYFEACDSYFPMAGVEYYYYDQLGSTYSDQPDDPDLWEIPRFVDEVEQVRRALGLDASNFYLLGQSWGGALAIEYGLAHGQHLRGLLISNMMSSIPAYNAYAADVLMPAIDPLYPAELSHTFMTDILRKQFGYDGVALTDALYMQGITAKWDMPTAAVMALNAGNDMLLGPTGADQMIAMLNAIKAALQNGTLSKARVDEAATRIIALKMADHLMPAIPPQS